MQRNGYDVVDVQTLFHGAWTWYSDPRILDIGKATLVGGVDSTGSILVAAYDNASPEDCHTFVLHEALQVDDHCTPAFMLRAYDQRILAFYSAHNGGSYYLRVSTNPLDSSAWLAEVDLNSQLGLSTYCYANPVELRDGISLFFRGDPGTGWSQYYSKSEDGGATWTTAVRWVENGPNRPYFKCVKNGAQRIDFTLTDGHPNAVATSIYHGYTDGENWYRSDGSIVGAGDDMPFSPSDFTQVYDGATIRAWNHQIAIDPAGRPVIVYATFPTTHDHRYRYARWDGRVWSDHEVCAAGRSLYPAEPHYSGGIAVDPTNIDIVYVSRETRGVHQIWKYETPDCGATWRGTQLTHGDNKAFRPFSLGGGVLYITGAYHAYTSYDTHVVLRTERRKRLTRSYKSLATVLARLSRLWRH